MKKLTLHQIYDIIFGKKEIVKKMYYCYLSSFEKKTLAVYNGIIAKIRPTFARREKLDYSLWIVYDHFVGQK